MKIIIMDKKIIKNILNTLSLFLFMYFLDKIIKNCETFYWLRVKQRFVNSIKTPYYLFI